VVVRVRAHQATVADEMAEVEVAEVDVTAGVMEGGGLDALLLLLLLIALSEEMRDIEFLMIPVPYNGCAVVCHSFSRS